MKYKLLVMLFVAIVIISIAFFVGISKANDSSSNSVNNISVTLSELNTHNNIDDCWVAYKGKVYDITSWLPRHPGKAEAILPYCGTAKEFEDAFTKQHGIKFASLLMKVGTFMGDFEDKGGLQ